MLRQRNTLQPALHIADRRKRLDLEENHCLTMEQGNDAEVSASLGNDFVRSWVSPLITAHHLNCFTAIHALFTAASIKMSMNTTCPVAGKLNEKSECSHVTEAGENLQFLQDGIR